MQGSLEDSSVEVAVRTRSMISAKDKVSRVRQSYIGWYTVQLVRYGMRSDTGTVAVEFGMLVGMAVIVDIHFGTRIGSVVESLICKDKLAL
jgi:hypothetical protein